MGFGPQKMGESGMGSILLKEKQHSDGVVYGDINLPYGVIVVGGNGCQFKGNVIAGTIQIGGGL
ncbi:UNKNOWN [Stylonychia lemnae]|uniref:Uncharacterized protein n=1 Tax=Stylonychia lemnae TaxID=5949 RepID=A0A077ZPY8_STYLE|nr:UNKNOWN [Stylonychia lemnae]|eukprot:CDW72002.1 UNKNOWN [Stylonychia lemnae]